MKPKSTRGGKREGAGRKPSPHPKVRISAHIESEQLEYLKSLDPDIAKALRKVIDDHQNVNEQT